MKRQNFIKATLCSLVATACLSAGAWADSANLASLELPQASIPGGNAVTARVNLQTPALDDNTWVEIRSEGPVHVPAAVRVPRGQTTASFLIHTDPVEKPVSVKLTTSVEGNSLQGSTLVLEQTAVTAR